MDERSVWAHNDPMRHLHIWSLVALVGVTGIGLGLNAAQEPDLRPSGKGIGTLDHPPMPEQAVAKGQQPSGQAAPGAKTGNGINYRGGPVMTNPLHIYFIWYGNWSTNTTAQTLLPYLASNIGASPYFRINTTYNNGASTPIPVTTDVTMAGTAVTTYPYGNALSDSQIRQVVIDAMNSKALPTDSDGLYFVLTSADVNATSGFCTKYCGWHTYFTANVGGTNKAFKYSFIGDVTRCLASCAAQSASPSGNPGADGMASILAHELEEAATDPQLNAWYDSRGYENADKCAWTFGSTYAAANGSLANMKLGPNNTDFLIQRNWVNANGGYCALSY